MNIPAKEPKSQAQSPSCCVSIDLEVGKRDSRIHKFAAVRSDTGESFVFEKGNLPAALKELDKFASPASYILGHNLIAFDAPHLAAANPGLKLLKFPMVDTLRLSPLAFPRNPYHQLIKHYQDGQLKRGRLNDPVLDARLTLDVFHDQQQALSTLNKTNPDLLLAWHWLATQNEAPGGLTSLFEEIRKRTRPQAPKAQAAIERLLTERACLNNARGILEDIGTQSWPLAYTLAWLSVAGGNSVMAPWVRHQFPEAGKLIRRLRDTACEDPGCAWCGERHNAQKELVRWFGFTDFRPDPVGPDGKSLQKAIVKAAMRGEHALAILPTGGGKSLCYQIPALSRYDKTGALTVVVSPLVALMADQIAGLEAHGITSCAAINGLLSMPERAEAFERVRLGDIGILIVSPEQLRNRTLQKTLAQRQIGAWVLDEAHCISKWGHDFRPDYRYIARFIKEKSGEGAIPPVLCLTATAKPDVIDDIINHFKDKVGITLSLFNGGAERTNLVFAVVRTTPAEKFTHIHDVLCADLPPDTPGGAIVYCASRRMTEEVADFLTQKKLAAGHFHAGLTPTVKKDVQTRFIRGDLRVICATNAFGMGIDKPDVRLVIHADIPGSLENYLQEAGRAGRDRKAARCVLLYTPEDVERQFGMSARSRLSRHEIQAILRALKHLDRKKRFEGEVVATAGEILSEDTEAGFVRDSATDDTRVRTAIAWLEEATLVSREENQVQIFPASLRVSSTEEARKKLSSLRMTDDYRNRLMAIIEALISANPDEGLSTDELMSVSGLSAEKVRNALHDLERLGIASNDTAITVFVAFGVERSSVDKLKEAVGLETAFIDELRSAAPGLGKGESSLLHLRQATQRLKDAGHSGALPEKLRRIIRSIALDGRREEGGTGSLRQRRLDAETIEITLLREWSKLAETAALRRTGAECLLKHLIECLPKDSRGTDLLAKTTLGNLLSAIESDLLLRSQIKDPQRLLDRALLWLHELDVIRLNKGLAIFRPAMTVRIGADRRGFARNDFAPLQIHYDEQVIQIHIMAEYAARGLRETAEAVRLAMDYFNLSRDNFMRRWLPDREKELSRQTTPESWRRIVEALNNPAQQRIVADERDQTNVLVLAGPGSGKTKALVHRIAYLVRARRENPRGILALAYNRHAAVEIRRRLLKLIGDDARGITVLTCHALAMRLAGISFVNRSKEITEDTFRDCLKQAIALLTGSGLPPEEADEQRERLLAGFRWILVDEYQDIGREQYELISALAGRTLQDDDGKLSLFAVGDDDQNIYSFNGASVEFIRRFEKDYAAKPSFLIDNYRSSSNIITVANSIIKPAKDRLKVGHSITIDSTRRNHPGGGKWERLDLVGQGRVQVLPAGNNDRTQAVAVMMELQRLSKLDPEWDWAKTAVIARQWHSLEPVRSYCELHGIAVQMADEDSIPFWSLREAQQLVAWLRSQKVKIAKADAIGKWLDAQPKGPWWALVQEALSAYSIESSGAELLTGHFIEWLAEWGREIRRKQTGLMLLSAHRAKGLEFDHVAILDGDWDSKSQTEDPDASRRLYYVAMTRARQTLTLARIHQKHPILQYLPAGTKGLLIRPPMELPEPEPQLAHQHQRLSMREVDIGFAGRFPESDPIHESLSSLSPGDALSVRKSKYHWELIDRGGNTVGKLAKAFELPKGLACLSAKVRAIIVVRREAGDPKYLPLYPSPRWEAIIPELLFAPTPSNT